MPLRRRRSAVPTRALAAVAGVVVLLGVVTGGAPVRSPVPGMPDDVAAASAAATTAGSGLSTTAGAAGTAVTAGPPAGPIATAGATASGPTATRSAQRATTPVTADPGASTAADSVLVTPGLRPIPVPRLVPRDTVGPRWLTPADRAAGLLALDVPAAASGVLDVVPGSVPAPGGVGVRTVRVEVERGLPVDGAAFATTVLATLNDPRGWGARGDVTFARTDGPADLRVVLASPALVDAMCAPLRTGGEVSCGRNGHAALNVRRWADATDEFADRTLYRQYLVNHEVGHLLGHPHERCPGPGQPAPLMQQQTVRVAPCVPNGWPHPQG